MRWYRKVLIQQYEVIHAIQLIEDNDIDGGWISKNFHIFIYMYGSETSWLGLNPKFNNNIKNGGSADINKT